MDFLRYAEDKNEIEQVYILYCDLVDHKQFDGMVNVFTQDAVGDYSAAYGTVVEGVAPLIAAMHANLGAGSNCGRTHHNVGNFRVSVDGDAAESRAHYYAVHQGLNAYEGQIYSMWGEYHDFWIRTQAGWRVNRRFYSIFLTQGPHQICGRP
jgi:ketosteroid isomerase-like protein